MPVGVTVDVTVKRGLDPALLMPALTLGMERALQAVAPTVKAAIRPQRFSDALRFIVAEPDEGIVTGTIGLPRVKRSMAARFMETGVAAHTITPRDTLVLQQVTETRIVAQRQQGKPMRFKIGDRWISTHMVRHPGMVPHPWLQPSLDQHGETIAEKITEAAQQAYAEPGGDG